VQGREHGDRAEASCMMNLQFHVLFSLTNMDDDEPLTPSEPDQVPPLQEELVERAGSSMCSFIAPSHTTVA
jgi:hypothetical protein